MTDLKVVVDGRIIFKVSLHRQKRGREALERIYLAQVRAGIFEHGNKILNSINGKEFLE